MKDDNTERCTVLNGADKPQKVTKQAERRTISSFLRPDGDGACALLMADDDMNESNPFVKAGSFSMSVD